MEQNWTQGEESDWCGNEWNELQNFGILWNGMEGNESDRDGMECIATKNSNV